MKRRKFQLESVLNYRKGLEEKAHSEFMKIKGALDEEEKQLSKLIEKKKKYEEDLKRRGMQPSDPQELNLYHSYLLRVRDEIEIQHKRVQEAAKRCDDQKEVLLSVSKDKRMMEKLKERQEDTVSYQIKREDKKSMDECARGGLLRNET